MFQSAAKECAESIEILTAEDGLELMELLEKEPMPDVVLLDLNLLRMSGYDCLKI